MKCKYCDCEVTNVRLGDGRHKGEPVLCSGCRYGGEGHKKMAKPNLDSGDKHE